MINKQKHIVYRQIEDEHDFYSPHALAFDELSPRDQDEPAFSIWEESDEGDAENENQRAISIHEGGDADNENNALTHDIEEADDAPTLSLILSNDHDEFDDNDDEPSPTGQDEPTFSIWEASDGALSTAPDSG